jgi:hypothetical protein
MNDVGVQCRDAPVNYRRSPGWGKENRPVTIWMEQKRQPFPLPDKRLDCTPHTTGQHMNSGGIATLPHDGQNTVIPHAAQPQMKPAGGNGGTAAAIKCVAKNRAH